MRRISKDALHGGIDGGEAAFEIKSGDNIVRVIDQRAVTLLALGKLGRAFLDPALQFGLKLLEQMGTKQYQWLRGESLGKVSRTMMMRRVVRNVQTIC
jgi:hypothetical protein